jgi:Tol biopolymer transport system component/predicted Ser/Thr protein kinase
VINQTISHYFVTEKLGEGGMGVVYKAQDTKLGRAVALKFLAPHLLRDEEARKRFHREAKAAAKLDHPNICTVYEIDEVDGKTFIVMAFLEGRPLSKKIAEGPLKLNEALSVAGQIAEGLEAAHENGVVHRDIKPDNIMLLKGSRGLVKIMDFGLAQLAGSSKLTRGGSTLGTMSYMSPEQAQGAEVDRRSDVWSFGVVLYEMVSGQPPFRGDFDQAVVYSIVNEAPEPLTAVRTGVPKQLEDIVNKALSKKPEERHQHADDLVADLRRLQKEREFGQTRSAVPVPKRSRTGLYAVTAWLGVWGPTQAPLRPVPLTSDPGHELHPTFSPDGNQVAFDWDGENRDNTDIYVKLVAGGEPLRLTTNPAVDRFPAWSPDGSQIAFLRRSEGSGGIFLVPPIGGAERKLAEGPHFRVGRFSGLSWSPDGKFLAVSDRTSPEEPWAIFLVSVESGEKERLTSPPPQSLADHSPAFSPDGRTLAFVRQSAVVLADVYLVQVDGGEPRRLTFNDQTTRGLAWTPDGREIVFSSNPGGGSNRSLWRISSLGGMPELLSGTAGDASYPAISRQGSRLIYSRRTRDLNIWRLQLSGLTTTRNRPTRLIASTRWDFYPQISPDGARIAFESHRSGSPEVWVCDRDGRGAVQLTSFAGVNAGSPCWSPDGRWIAFDAAPDGNGDIYVISADGGSPRRLTTEGSGDTVPSWSRDGKWIYFSSTRTGINQVWKAPAAGGEAVQVTKKGAFPAFEESPDGKFVFYAKPEGSPRDPTAVWRVPAEGGEEVAVLDSPRPVKGGAWAVVEQGIYFIDVERSEALAAEGFLNFFHFGTGQVTRIASLGEQLETFALQVAVSPDGSWILYVQNDQSQADLMLVENFR